MGGRYSTRIGAVSRRNEDAHATPIHGPESAGWRNFPLSALNKMHPFRHDASAVTTRSIRPVSLFNLTRTVLPGLMLCLSFAASALAQARPGDISGVVRDDHGRPIEGAILALDSIHFGKRASTDQAGRFRFTGESPGLHALRVVRIGYSPLEMTFELPDGGADLILVLRRIVRLDTVTVRAAQTGIFGKVIAKDGFRPLSGAHVTTAGSGTRTRTSTDGGFSIPNLREGAYMVFVQHADHEAQLISVFVPRDSAVEIAAILNRAETHEGEKRMTHRLADFEARVRWKGQLSAVIPRQEFMGRLDVTLRDAIGFAPSFLKSGLVIRDAITCIFVDGDPRPIATLADFKAGDVLALEVYGLRQEGTGTLQSRWPAGIGCGNSGTAPPTSGSKVGLQRGMRSGREPMDNIARAVVIWLKR